MAWPPLRVHFSGVSHLEKVEEGEGLTPHLTQERGRGRERGEGGERERRGRGEREREKERERS